MFREREREEGKLRSEHGWKGEEVVREGFLESATIKERPEEVSVKPSGARDFRGNSHSSVHSFIIHSMWSA